MVETMTTFQHKSQMETKKKGRKRLISFFSGLCTQRDFISTLQLLSIYNKCLLQMTGLTSLAAGVFFCFFLPPHDSVPTTFKSFLTFTFSQSSRPTHLHFHDHVMPRNKLEKLKWRPPQRPSSVSLFGHAPESFSSVLHLHIELASAHWLWCRLMSRVTCKCKLSLELLSLSSNIRLLWI